VYSPEKRTPHRTILSAGFEPCDLRLSWRFLDVRAGVVDAAL